MEKEVRWAYIDEIEEGGVAYRSILASSSVSGAF